MSQNSSFGNKATRTGKCSCDNPKWSDFELRITSSEELVITLSCANCGALWDTKSRTARKFVSESKLKNLEAADNRRKEYLKRSLKVAQDRAEAAEKELRKVQSELELLENAPVVPEEQ